MRTVIALFGCWMALFASRPAAATDPVWDPEEIARLAERSAQMSVALSRAVDLLNSVDNLSRTLGRSGSLAQLDFSHFDVVAELQGVGPQIGGVAAKIAGGGVVTIASFSDASALVKKLTTAPSGNGQATNLMQLQQAWDSLQRTAAEDGFALSQHTRQSLTQAPARADVLVAQASSANDARGDAVANTAAGLAVLEQLTSVKAMLASILEIQTAHQLGRAMATQGGVP